MANPTTMVEEAHASANGVTADTPEPDRAALEQRLQRVEDAIASLIDARTSTNRAIEHPVEQRQTAPQAVPVTPATSITSDPPEAPREVNLAAMATLAAAALNSPLLHRPSAFTPFDLMSEARAIPRMFFDRQYRVGWWAKLVVLLLVPLLLTSQWWFPFAGFVVIGPIIDKVFVLLAACAGYKVLSREAQRFLLFKTTGSPIGERQA